MEKYEVFCSSFLFLWLVGLLCINLFYESPRFAFSPWRIVLAKQHGLAGIAMLASKGTKSMGSQIYKQVWGLPGLYFRAYKLYRSCCFSVMSTSRFLRLKTEPRSPIANGSNIFLQVFLATFGLYHTNTGAPLDPEGSELPTC